MSPLKLLRMFAMPMPNLEMSPLKISLLLRMFAMPMPNRDLPTAQAFAPAMVEAINEFRARGLVYPEVNAHVMVAGWPTERRGEFLRLITPKGDELARQIIVAAGRCYLEVSK